MISKSLLQKWAFSFQAGFKSATGPNLTGLRRSSPRPGERLSAFPPSWSLPFPGTDVLDRDERYLLLDILAKIQKRLVQENANYYSGSRSPWSSLSLPDRLRLSAVENKLRASLQEPHDG